MKKKLLLTFITICLSILTFSTFHVHAATTVNSGTCGTNLTWTLTDDGILTISGTGNMTNFNMNYTNTMPPWWNDKGSITSIVIEDGVTSIGNQAFRACFYLTSVSMPDSVTSIGSYAFYSCSKLNQITLSKNIQTIPTYGFYNCNKLTEIILPEKLVTIGTYAFNNCYGLTQITIPHGTKNIYTGAFDSCSKLKTVYKYASSTWTYTFSSSPTIKTLYLITYMLNGQVHSTETVHPSKNAVLLQEPYECFYEYSVDNKTWTGVNINQDYTVVVTEIPAYTITYTGAYTGTQRVKSGTNAKLPTPPDYYVYSFTSNGKTWTGENIKGNVTVNVTQKATCGENLTWSINNNGTLIITGTGKMYDFTSASPAPWYSQKNNIKSVSLPSGLTHIGNRAFYYCTGLTNVSIPSNVSSIGGYSFYGCQQLSSISLPNTITSINAGVFGYCKSLKTISLPDKITKLDDDAFYYSGIESIVLPNNLERIGEYTFSGCTSLKNISVSSNIKYIEADAFENVTLDNVYVNDLSSWLNIYFYGSNRGSGYTTSNPLANGANLIIDGKTVTDITIPTSITMINPGAFCGYQKLKKVIIPSQVTSVGKDAFNGCGNLEYAKISSSSIGIQAFYKCSNLKTAILDGQLTTIPDNSFGYCSNLITIDIPNTVTYIQSGAFYYCTALESVGIPSNIQNIGGAAFTNCSSIKKVYISNLSSWMKAYIGNNANPFAYGAQMYINGELVTHLVIPEDVVTFQNMGSCAIESIYVHRNVSQIIGGSSTAKIVYLPVDKDYFSSNFPNATLKKYCIIDYWKNDELVVSETVYVGDNSSLPTPPEGKIYYYEADGVEWTGKNVTWNATVSIYDGAMVTYTGDYSDTLTVKTGSDVILPKSSQGGIFIFENEGNEWSGVNITENTTVEVIKLTPFEHNPDAGWNYKNNIIRVGGTGTMPDGISGMYYPWYDDKYRTYEVRIGNGITNIGCYAFDTCNKLTTVSIGNSVETIGIEAFDDCALISSIAIPDSVKLIGDYAFEDCYALSSVSIGKGLETIGRRAFRYNETVEYVINEENPYFKTIDGNIFSKDGTVLIRYAIGKKDTSYVIPNGVTTIGFAAFESATSLKNITIPESVTLIEDSAFYLVDCYLKEHDLSNVHYLGSPSEWNLIEIEYFNDAIARVKKTFAKSDFAISAECTKSADGYDFNVNLQKDKVKDFETAFLIAVLYGNDRQFITLSKIPISNNDVLLPISVKTTEDVKEAKLMLWKDFETLIPLCESTTIDIEQQ